MTVEEARMLIKELVVESNAREVYAYDHAFFNPQSPSIIRYMLKATT